MDIRFAEDNHAASMLDLYEALDTETGFMFFEPGERNTMVEEIKTRISSSVAIDSLALCVAVEHDAIVGFSAGFSSVRDRNRHVAKLVVGVRESALALPR